MHLYNILLHISQFFSAAPELSPVQPSLPLQLCFCSFSPLLHQLTFCLELHASQSQLAIQARQPYLLALLFNILLAQLHFSYWQANAVASYAACAAVIALGLQERVPAAMCRASLFRHHARLPASAVFTQSLTVSTGIASIWGA